MRNRKRKRFKSSVLRSPLLRLPHNPPVHLPRPGFIFVRAVGHHFAHTRQLKESNQPLLPSRLDSSTRTPPGSRPSQASALAAATLGQWSSTWERDMRACPWQNQHLSSSCFLILFRYSAERQWPVRIWATVRAMAFRAESRQDFLGGGWGDLQGAVVGGILVPLFFLCPEPLRDLEF